MSAIASSMARVGASSVNKMTGTLASPALSGFLNQGLDANAVLTQTLRQRGHDSGLILGIEAKIPSR
jgi:hypothetical protein